ncbi:hypothetical protein M514_23058 [Trichuris suis]|uniref:Uncharacterized protein n=1 Tax=Trichuris suis TaxID=68888 RepID=A0A085N5I9_9BILA|nr:hypothetical protein M514_23058 [Trichuris suis]
MAKFAASNKYWCLILCKRSAFVSGENAISPNGYLTSSRRQNSGDTSCRLSLKLVDSVLLVNSLTSIEMSYPYIRCAHPLYPKYSLEHLENGVFPIHISLRDTLMTFSQSQQLCVS